MNKESILTGLWWTSSIHQIALWHILHMPWADVKKIPWTKKSDVKRSFDSMINTYRQVNCIYLCIMMGILWYHHNITLTNSGLIKWSTPRLISLSAANWINTALFTHLMSAHQLCLHLQIRMILKEPRITVLSSRFT